MSMNLAVLKEEGTGCWKTVFPDNWIQEYNLPDEYDWVNDDLNQYRNSDYRPELEFNLSNINFVYIMRDVLGFQGNAYGGFEVDIDRGLSPQRKSG